MSLGELEKKNEEKISMSEIWTWEHVAQPVPRIGILAPRRVTNTRCSPSKDVFETKI